MEGRIPVLIFVLMVFLGVPAEGTAPIWCAQSSEAYKKCSTISRLNNGQVGCVLGLGEEDCYTKIASGEADLSTFDGGSIFDAGKKYNLTVILSERLKSLATSGTKYFAVAVVKKSSSLKFSTLKGARSCHTGVQKSSGWILPVGILLNSGVMQCVKGDQYASVADFFDGSCAPGAANLRYNKKLYGAEKLCRLCSGQGEYKCARNSREPYYGYEGAFKCLKDGVGDVAFIKQSILTALSPSNQAKYKLLCPDDSIAEPKDYLKCALAGSPAHAIMTRGSASPQEIEGYRSLLERAAKAFGPYSPLSVFDGKILSRRAIGLDRTPPHRMFYKAYLGQGYIDAISSLEGCQ